MIAHRLSVHQVVARRPAARRPAARRAFSLIEFMIALTISSTLLAATMAALDASFKSYKATTESASLNLSTRLAMHRLNALIRNGEEFGPFPLNPIATPEVTVNELEFVANRDVDEGTREVWRIEKVAVDAAETARGLGPWKLEAEVTTFDGATEVASFRQTLMYRVTEALFTLEYEPGPRLVKATVDLTVGVREDQADTVHSDLTTPQVRMVSSVRPRRLIGEL
ncbi:MAG: prepilin-type N-terminal cleavage/methylation domain-containing protein [Planctomycetota bacterium]